MVRVSVILNLQRDAHPFNSLHTRVLICGHRHWVACLHTSTFAHGVLKRISLFLVTRFESKKQSPYLRHCPYNFFVGEPNFECASFCFVVCFRSIASSRVNTGHSLVWSELRPIPKEDNLCYCVYKLGLLTYLLMTIAPGVLEHRSSTTPRHRTLFWAVLASPVGPLLFQLCFSVSPPTVARPASLSLFPWN